MEHADIFFESADLSEANPVKHHPFCSQAFVRATHSQWTSVYFISFYVLAIVYMLNLVSPAAFHTYWVLLLIPDSQLAEGESQGGE